MIEELIAFEGYIAEVGDLGVGLRGSKPGNGVLLELDGRYIEIRGLRSPECRVSAELLRGCVRMSIVAVKHKLS